MMLVTEGVGQQSWIAGDINLTQTNLCQKGKASVHTTYCFKSTVKKIKISSTVRLRRVICNLSLSLSLSTQLFSLLVVSASILTLS